MDNTYTPLVTDDDCDEMTDTQEANYEALHRAEHKALRRSPAQTYGQGWAHGMSHVTDLYENDRRQTHAELAELRAENERMREAGSLCAAMLKGLGDGHYAGSFHFGADIRVDAKERFEAWDTATLKPSQPSTKDTE